MATTINKLYMEIKPGIGVGEVHYGMTEQEVISKLGRPDRVDESEYVEGIGNINRELWYSSRNITFTFDEEDDFRLGVITIMGSSYRLFGKELFGLELEKTKKIVTRESGEIPRFEDWSR